MVLTALSWKGNSDSHVRIFLFSCTFGLGDLNIQTICSILQCLYVSLLHLHVYVGWNLLGITLIVKKKVEHYDTINTWWSVRICEFLSGTSSYVSGVQLYEKYWILSFNVQNLMKELKLFDGFIWCIWEEIIKTLWSIYLMYMSSICVGYSYI